MSTTIARPVSWPALGLPERCCEPIIDEKPTYEVEVLSAPTVLCLGPKSKRELAVLEHAEDFSRRACGLPLENCSERLGGFSIAV